MPLEESDDLHWRRRRGPLRKSSHLPADSREGGRGQRWGAGGLGRPGAWLLDAGSLRAAGCGLGA